MTAGQGTAAARSGSRGAKLRESQDERDWAKGRIEAGGRGARQSELPKGASEGNPGPVKYLREV